jgi:mono/diheme cytochrome c family protein
MLRLAVLTALACTSVLTACGDTDDDEGNGSGNGDPTAGKAVYDVHCAGCHGASGEGSGNYPSVAGEGGSEAIDIVTNGDDAMPAFGGTLTEQEIADVVAYLDTL